MAAATGQVVGQLLEGGGAVEVVGVGHPERAVEGRGGGHEGVGRPEGLRPPGGGGRHRRRLEILADVLRPEVGRPVALHVALHRLDDLAPHDQHQPAEAGGDGVAGGVVDEGRAPRPDGGDLLGPPEAGPHPGGEQHERRRGHGRGAYRAPVRLAATTFERVQKTS